MAGISFQIIRELQLVYFQGRGEISFATLIDNIKAVHQHPDFAFHMHTFVDFGAARVAPEDPGLDDYIDFFSRLQASTTPRKWAIYTRDRQTHISANMVHLLHTRGVRVDVFQQREAALDFLGIQTSEQRRQLEKQLVGQDETGPLGGLAGEHVGGV